VEGSVPSEIKNEIAHGAGVGNVGASATRDSFVSTVEKKKTLDDGDARGLTGTLSGSRSGQAPLRRE
jgi:hypothetical protein